MIVTREIVLPISSFTKLEHPWAGEIVVQEVASDFHHGGGWHVSYVLGDYPDWLTDLEVSLDCTEQEAVTEAIREVIEDLKLRQKTS